MDFEYDPNKSLANPQEHGINRKAQQFDDAFEDGGDILDQLDLTKAERPGVAARRVNVDFPEWMLNALDQEATRVGVARQALIKVWLAERLEQAPGRRP